MSGETVFERFTFPPTAAGEPAPIWKGASFAIGDDSRRIIAYDVGASGWSDDLTALHEDASPEGAHFIDVASRRAALAGLARVPADGIVLEVGVSSGHFIEAVRAARPDLNVLGADYTLGTLRTASERLPNVPLLQMDLTRPALPDACVDAIVILNVLEHIEDDAAALNNCYRMLKPGGLLVVEVPAGPWLYDDYDRALMHVRRYTSGELMRKVRNAGYRVLKSTHLGVFIYPPFAAVKFFGKHLQAKQKTEAERAAGVAQQIKMSSSPLGDAIMNLELAVGKIIPYPCGVRCWALCQRPA